MSQLIKTSRNNKLSPSFKSLGIKTIIDENTMFEGNLITNSSILFKGVLNGHLHVRESNALTLIYPPAKITNGITAENLMIYGEVHGPIKCRDVRFMRGSVFKGELEYTNIKIDTGAIVNADCMVCKEFGSGDYSND